jgi:multidrug resistance efflux pump
MRFHGFAFRWRLHLVPILVWLGAVACVAVLFSRRSARFEVLGIAQGQSHQIAATCPARLRSVPVQLFDQVTKGQTLAIVNTLVENEQPRSVLQAQLETALAEIEQLTAQLVPTEQNILADNADRQTTRISDARRFSADVENAQLEVLRLRVVIETDKIAIEDLAVDVKITEELVGKQAIAPYELQKVKAQYDALAKKIEENARLLEEADGALKQALERQREYAQQPPLPLSQDAALEVIRKAIKVQEKRMNELLVEIESLDTRQTLELKAPCDGVVTQVVRRPTDVVLAGDPILTITQTGVTGILGYAAGGQLSGIAQGTVVELIKQVQPTQVQVEHSVVTFVGPAVEQIPARLWHNPNVPEWGMPFLVQAPVQMHVIVGETVGIRRLSGPEM